MHTTSLYNSEEDGSGGCESELKEVQHTKRKTRAA